MGTSDIAQLITSVGFPIVACCAAAYYIKYISDKNREEVADLNKQHQEEMMKVTEAINNNTLVITKLCEKLNGGVKE